MRGIAVLLLLLLAAPAAADEEVRRLVIGLYDTSNRHDELDTEDPIHQMVEMPLNYLGMVVRRHDIRAGVPPAAWLERARAVVTRFDAARNPPEWLWPWLEDAVLRRKLRIVHIGDFGPLAHDPRRLAAWLKNFGLEHDDMYLEKPLGLVTKVADRKRCIYEADARSYGLFLGPRSVGKPNRPWVRTWIVDAKDDVRCPVVTGPWGALALDPWAPTEGGELDDRRWHIDPFAFLREALGLDGVPAPHPQVLNGRRMFFVQVDGDGFENVSTAKRAALSAAVFKDEILRRFELPFTVSIVVASLTKDYAVKQPTARMELAREIFALENVEPASHGVLHTLRWEVPGAGDFVGPTIASYPRLENYAYSRTAEVEESVRFINERLLPPDKRCAVMLWTGFANPREAPIRAAGKAGCLNLNGGVYRWDRWFNSVGFVSPWGIRRGEMLQVYAGAANENDFDGFFTSMPGAFGHIGETIRRSGDPRILKPADVYCHFYSAERPARLTTLRRLIRDWGVDRETAPVFASTYARAVHDALTRARVLRREDGWELRDFGACRSARIDGETRAIDWRESRGLLGARRRNGALHLHLSGPDARIVFATAPAPHPHVEEANCVLENVRLAPGEIAVTATAHNARFILFAGLPKDVEVQVAVGDETTPQRTRDDGRLAVRLPGPGTTRVHVRLP